MSMDKAQFTDFQIKRMAEAIADTSEECPAIIASLKAALHPAPVVDKDELHNGIVTAWFRLNNKQNAANVVEYLLENYTITKKGGANGEG